jgi:hypothetical protein
MAARTRKISVNFFQVQPNPQNDFSYDRLRNAFNALDVSTLNDRPHRIDFVLDCEYAKREKGFLTGAISNGQTGGVMPLRRKGKGLYDAAIGPGERLGHPSCFVYDIERSLLLLENLPGGATPADWCFYFKSHLRDSPVISAAVVEKQTSESLLDDIKYLTRFQVAIAQSRQRNLFSENVSDLALGEITDLSAAARARTLDCTLSTEVKRLNKKKQRPGQESLDKGYVKRMLNKLAGNAEVKTLTIAGLTEEESPRIEVINLLEFRLTDTTEVPIAELSAANLNLAKRIIRLNDLLLTHREALSRYDRPNEP